MRIIAKLSSNFCSILRSCSTFNFSQRLNFFTDESLDSVNCEKKTLIGEIDQGRPVAVGWLHYGPPSAPTGGGYW